MVVGPARQQGRRAVGESAAGRRASYLVDASRLLEPHAGALSAEVGRQALQVDREQPGALPRGATLCQLCGKFLTPTELGSATVRLRGREARRRARKRQRADMAKKGQQAPALPAFEATFVCTLCGMTNARRFTTQAAAARALGKSAPGHGDRQKR